MGEQGKKDGRIKVFSPSKIGDMALNILKLPKAGIADASHQATSPPSSDKRRSSSIANLDDITEEDSSFTTDDDATIDKKVEKKTAKPVLPPVQTSRTINPNSNYYRKISADYHKKRDKFKLSMRSSINSPIQERLSILDQINATGTKANFTSSNGSSKPLQSIPTNRTGGYIKTGGGDTSSSHLSKKGPYEWNHRKILGPIKLEKHLNDAQTFWRQGDSLSVNKVTRVALPAISKT